MNIEKIGFPRQRTPGSIWYMMTSSNGNIFRVTGLLWGEFTGDRWPVNSPKKGRWRGALMFSLICARINDWVSNREAGDLRRHSVENHVCLSYVTQREWYFASRAESRMAVSWGFDFETWYVNSNQHLWWKQTSFVGNLYFHIHILISDHLNSLQYSSWNLHRIQEHKR